jgi:hypothetical protein
MKQRNTMKRVVEYMGGTINPGYSKGKVSTCVVFKPNRNRRDNRKRSIRQWL